jgi:hypothetical protein
VVDQFYAMGSYVLILGSDVKKIASHIDIMIKINDKMCAKSAGHEPMVLSSMP